MTCATAILWIPISSTSLAPAAVHEAYFAPMTTTLSMPDGANAGPGAIVQVPISVSPGDGIFGIDLTLHYDTAILEAQDVTVSGIAASAGFALVRNLNTSGTIIISTYANQDALVGSGEIALVQFHVVGTPGDASSLMFTRASINESGIPVGFDPGVLTVTCAGAANGTACNGDPCTANETCQANACTGGEPLQAPPEVTHVTFEADRSTITWDSAGTGAETVYHVVRGLVSQLPVGAGLDEACLENAISGSTVSDPGTPSPSDSYWYLVRVGAACGIGTYGFRGIHGAPGAERTTSTCP